MVLSLWPNQALEKGWNKRKRKSMENTLNGSKPQFSLQDLMKALQDTEDGERPVEKWNPDYCGEMDMVIKSDGSWWHEGGRITRKGLVGLFASILRKDEDGPILKR